MSADGPPPQPSPPPGGPSDRSSTPDGALDGALDRALDRARSAARARGQAARAARGRQRPGPRQPSRGVGFTGPGPDERDPQPIGHLVSGVVTDQGWSGGLSEGAIAGRWAELVGAEVAAHCRPQRLEAGELHLVAESTAWATQLRLLAPTLVRRLADQLGPNVVRRVLVTGPGSPSWRRGPWRVAGRGPRDTYG